MNEIEEVLGMLHAVKDSDYEEMLHYIPDGIEHRASQYRAADDFESVGSYEEDARYSHPAQNKLKEAVLEKAIKLLQSIP